MLTVTHDYSENYEYKAFHKLSKQQFNYAYPKMTAFHTMILFSDGAPLTPAGGSSCRLQDKYIKFNNLLEKL